MRLRRSEAAIAFSGGLAPWPAYAAEGDATTGGIYLLLLIAFYLLPTFVASTRKHQQTSAIFWLNLLLGWSVLGWIAAFIWAFTNSATPVVINSSALRSMPALPAADEKKCPRCAEMVKLEAKICRFCGGEFSQVALVASPVMPLPMPGKDLFVRRRKPAFSYRPIFEAVVHGVAHPYQTEEEAQAHIARYRNNQTSVIRS